MGLHLISLNIERSKHLLRVIPFLTHARPDVTCIQELCEPDIQAFEKVAGNLVAFAPMSRYPTEGRPVVGIGIFARIPVETYGVEYYRGNPDTIPNFDFSSAASKYASENAMFLYADFEHEGSQFRIGTTHFTWTPDGAPDDFQRKDLKALLQILSALGELVFCGDFNAPRGGEIFSELAGRYTDNIPKDILWSIDRDLHRAGREKLETEVQKSGLPGLLVDGLFSTPGYVISNVILTCGISDHCAIRADIERARV